MYQLTQIDFEVFEKEKATPIMNDADVRLFLQNCNRSSLKVVSKAVEFSEIDFNAVRKWAKIDSQIRTDGKLFTSAIIDESDPRVMAIIDHAVADLKYKDAVYGPITTQCAEALVREYISPILIAATNIAREVKLWSEKEICGTLATGPLDYAILYKEFYTVITEAKRDNLDSAIVQNLAQMIASRETYLFNTNGMKRGYLDMAGQIAQVPSTGIVSTGKEWILLRYYLFPEPYVMQSNPLFIPIGGISQATTDTEPRRGVIIVVGMIVGALKLHKDAVDALSAAKKQKV